MKKRYALLILLHLFLLASLQAQQIRNFPALTGKKDIAVNCIIQCKEGYLWFGTNDGLVRFDGKRSLILKKEDGLSSPEISCLLQTSKNELWAGHKNGKISIVKNNKADTFQLNPQLPESRITAFLEAADGSIWISTYGDGLYHYASNKLDHFTSKEGLRDDLIYGMTDGGTHGIWMGTDAGITILNRDSNFESVTSEDGLPDNIVRSICFDDKDRAIIAMQDSGICYYDLKKHTIVKDHFFRNWNQGAITKVVYVKERRELLFSVEKKGLFSLKDGKLNITDNTKGLLSNELNDVLIDREFNTWLASPRGACQLYEPRHTFFTTQNGFPSNTVSSVVVGIDGTTWLATDKGLSMIRSNGKGGFGITESKIDALKGEQVVCMMNDSQGRIWLGTYGAGIIIIDSKNGRHITLSMSTGLCDNNISNMVQDANGHIWISTLGGGISLLKEETPGKFSYTTFDEDHGLGSNYVYRVLPTKKHGVLVATDGAGLQRIEADSKITDAGKGLKSKTVYSIVEDRNGAVWLTTSDDGLVRYDGSFTSYTSKDGLRDPQAPILASVDDKIVLVHAKGVDVISSTHPKNITLFDISETDIEPVLNAFVNDGKGKLWVATNAGLLSFRVQDVFSDTITPPAFISNIKVMYKDYPLDSLTDFPSDQNSFIFDFSAILLKAPDKVHYRYKLSGYDKDWVYASGSNIATYNNLSAGRYEFRVEACNEEGRWGADAVYRFSIATPLWQQWWFWFLLAVICIAAVYLFLRFRLQALEREKITLENKVVERTTEIKKQSIIIQEKNKELEQLSLVASRTDNVVLIMDAEGRLEYVNESFTRLNNITLEELKAKAGETIFEISNNPRIREIIEDCIARRQSVVYESINTKVEGKIVWESSTLTPIFDEKGDLKKLIIIDTDITDRKEKEEIILQKNKDITDSLEYAQKIQHAILPPVSHIKEVLPHSFVFYLMKDIVSGDFYWFADKEDFFIIAAVDCTGHGVPGAFMSLIGYNLLNQIVNEKDIYEPAAILQELNEGVIQALYKNNPGNENKDGMDLALCKVYKNKPVVEFAGAMRPLWIVNAAGELTEIRGTKMPIGSLPSYGYKETNYVNHVVNCNKGDTFYIFTDGYADQFGGEKSKKFTTGKLKQLLQSMKGKDMDVQREQLYNTHMNWKGQHEQVDDILIIGFSI